MTKAPKELPATVRSVPDAPRDRSARRVLKNVPVKKGDTFGAAPGIQKRPEAINFEADSPPGTKKIELSSMVPFLFFVRVFT